MSTPQELLKSIWGYDSFRGPQAEIIESVIAGRDGLVIMPTGGGKSLCYQLPALIREGTAIIISPLIALMADQVAALHQLGVAAACLNSSIDAREQYDIRQKLRSGQLDLLYVAPERLLQPVFLDELRQTRIAMFAIDESHCVSQWGHDFRPEYIQLGMLADAFPDVPRLALTATADPDTQQEIVERLRLHDPAQFIAGFDRPNIRYHVEPKDNPKRQIYQWITQNHHEESGIVYCLSRKKTEQMAEYLNAAGIPAIAYHAGMTAAMRDQHQKKFVNDEVRVICATIAFGMGIDKPDVRFVCHHDPPKSIESYYQETGRAGRDGLPATAYCVYGLGDFAQLRMFIMDGDTPQDRVNIELHKLNALHGYCETARCRRHVLLEYFGEQTGEPCGNCDNCLNPVKTWDGLIPAQKALSAVARTGQRFGRSHITDILVGNATEKVEQFQHDQLPTFGVGREFNEKQWASIIRQLVAMGHLIVDLRRHGAMKLGETYKAVFAGEMEVKFREEQKSGKKRRAADHHAILEPTSRADQVLYQSLKDLRTELAREQGVPPYVVFSDRTLLEMVAVKPTSMAMFKAISGVGRKKLNRYGEAFLTLIGEHEGQPVDLSMTEMEPESMGAVPMPPNDLSKTVRQTLEMLFAGASVSEIAERRGYRETTIEGHLAEAALAGEFDPRDYLLGDGRLTIEQFNEIQSAWNQLADEDKEAGRLKPIFEQLDGRYEYGTLRLARAAILRERPDAAG